MSGFIFLTIMSDVFEKVNDLFSYVFIFGNIFPERHGFVAVPVTSSNNVSLH